MIATKKTNGQRDDFIVNNFIKRGQEYSTKPLKSGYYIRDDHIACIYDSDWYIGLVEAVCEEGDVR